MRVKKISTFSAVLLTTTTSYLGQKPHGVNKIVNVRHVLIDESESGCASGFEGAGAFERVWKGIKADFLKARAHTRADECIPVWR